VSTAQVVLCDYSNRWVASNLTCEHFYGELEHLLLKPMAINSSNWILWCNYYPSSSYWWCLKF